MSRREGKARARARAILSALMAGASALALAQPSHAQTVEREASEERMSYAIEAQPLAGALAEFARQSGLSALVAHARFAGARAPALNGAYTREEALARLLASTPFEGRIENRSIVISERAHPQRASAGAESEPNPAPARSERSGAGTQRSESAREEAPVSEEELVVTGTRIRGAPPAGANVISLSAEELRETGRSTLQDALAPLPQNFLGGQNELTQLQSNTGGNNTTFGSSINLRGLGADSTLTLVNGRRLAPGGVGNFIDISTIPLAAVERVEILADGASATYGSYVLSQPRQ